MTHQHMANPADLNPDLCIAVIGMSCRFPGADDVEAYWQNLRQGVESVSFFSGLRRVR